MSEFPREWTLVPLRDITTKIGSGSTPRGGDASYKSEGVPLIRSMNVHFDGFHREGLAFLDDQQADALRGVTVHSGDVLLNITGASIGRVTQAPPDMEGARVNQHVCIIRPIDGVDSRFISRYLASPTIQSFIAGENYGVTRQALTKGMIEEMLIPMPPIGEQRRIVAKLDSLVAHSTSARAELARIPRLAERHGHAALAAAFDGDLTGDNTSTWTQVMLGDLIVGIDAGKNVRCEERPPKRNERGIVKVSSVTWGEFDPQASKTPPSTVKLDARTRIRPGDFLISRANTLELVGACVIVHAMENENLYLSDKVLRLRFSQNVQDWVLFFLRSPAGRSQIEELATGNQLSMRNISQASLRSIVMPLPPAEVRSRIVTRVKTTLASVNKSLQEIDRAKALQVRLDQSMLAKAFRGELVPRDPKEEPFAAMPTAKSANRARALEGQGHIAKVRSRMPGNAAARNGGDMARKRNDVRDTHLTEVLRALGGSADARALWQRSEMDIDEFYKQLRDEMKAGRIKESSSKDRLRLANAT